VRSAKEKTGTHSAVVARAKDDGYHRIPISKDISNRLTWLPSTGSISAWLLVLSEGQFRLLSDEQVQAHEQLRELRAYIVDGALVEEPDPSFTEEPTRAVLPARLLPTEVELKKGWRISIPKALNIFLPAGVDTKDFTIVLSPGPYLDVWCTETFRRSSLVPLPEAE
jgi:hypothetical protein